MNRHRRPIIGVTGPDRGGAAAWLFTWWAVTMARGRAIRITPGHPATIDDIDGLIVGGGADVDPKLYGQELIKILEESPRQSRRLGRRIVSYLLLPLTWFIRKLAARASKHEIRDAARDALELGLIRAAVARGLPVLGICRGCQLINVHFGGSLHQSLRGFYTEEPEVRSILPRKRVRMPTDSRLACCIGRRPTHVNALHRQAIHQLGSGIRVAAKDRNGIVQAIEHESLPFVLGVQWHPEYLQQLPRQRAIFRKLVETARAAALRRSMGYQPVSDDVDGRLSAT